MSSRKWLIVIGLMLTVAALPWCIEPSLAQSATADVVTAPGELPEAELDGEMVPPVDNPAALDLPANPLVGVRKLMSPAERANTPAARAAIVRQGSQKAAAPPVAAVPGGTPDYFNTPNWANSPPMRKFVDSLPGLRAANKNNLGQYIPVAIPDTTTFPGSDYYEIELREYTEKMHSDMPRTKLRGYVQVNTTNPTVNKPHYLGPMIVAQKDRPVRIKFTNKLPTGAAGDLFLPVDTTIMGAGEGPKTAAGGNCDPAVKNCAKYTQNRATLHLHGGRSPWISDGTPHQWITPAGESTPYRRGVSTTNVPDMFFDAAGNVVPKGTPGATISPGPGSVTFFWSNQQSARLMFYHDHAWGITRLNVYAGEAAGYLLTDPVEQNLIASKLIPSEQIPLIIQDKTFVDAATINATDPTWNWGSAPPARRTGDLWWPHVYMPAQNPFNPDLSGINAMGRWHYGPWFFPPTPLCGSSPDAVPPYCVTNGPVPNPLYNPACKPSASVFCQPPEMPGTPNPSWGAEAFLDTPVINGTAYPKLTVAPKAYRFRILNAAHDRFFNLQLYEATPIVSRIKVTAGGSGYKSAPKVTITGGGGRGATAAATINPATGRVTAVDMITVGSGYTTVPKVTFKGGGGTGATATAVIYTPLKEVGMVPAAFNSGFPANWPADGREGGVPDPATRGPRFIQIGTEGGFLPAPVALPITPITWNTDPTMFNVGNVEAGTLILGPAERADVIVDFSKYAGKTLILYNDAPTAFPALDPHYDYYTSNPDRRDIGGAPPTRAGFGPNVRTIMQIRVTASAPAPAFNLAALEAAFKSTAGKPGIFEQDQSPIIVGQSAYDSAYNTTFPSTWPNWGISRISDTTLSFMRPDGKLVQNFPMRPKAIHDEMGATFDDFGRMSAKLGLEVPFVNAAIANFVLQNFVDKPTEVVKDGQTQIWKITHNGVDTHPIHFHLFEVQLINRVGWDGFIRLPAANELGWKETIRVSPLEDTIVALRPVAPKPPFQVPDSIRPLNPAVPLGSTMGFSQIDTRTGGPLVPKQKNELYNFGWEYVWHCHILSHEENDMMRSISFHVAPGSPRAVKAAVGVGAGKAKVSFNPPAATGGAPITSYTVTASPGGKTVKGTGSPIVVSGLTGGTSYSFKVTATNNVGTGPASAASNKVTPP